MYPKKDISIFFGFIAHARPDSLGKHLVAEEVQDRDLEKDC